MTTSQITSMIFLGLLLSQSNAMAQVETISGQELQRLQKALDEQKAKGEHQAPSTVVKPKNDKQYESIAPIPSKTIPTENYDKSYFICNIRNNTSIYDSRQDNSTLTKYISYLESTGKKPKLTSSGFFNVYYLKHGDSGQLISFSASDCNIKLIK